MFFPMAAAAAVAGVSTLNPRSPQYADHETHDAVRNFVKNGLDIQALKYATLANIYHENTGKELSYFPKKTADKIISKVTHSHKKRETQKRATLETPYPDPILDYVELKIGNDAKARNFSLSPELTGLSMDHIPTSAKDEKKTSIASFVIGAVNKGEVFSDTVAIGDLMASDVSLVDEENADGIYYAGIGLEKIGNSGPNFFEKLYAQGQLDKNAVAIDAKTLNIEIGGYNSLGLSWSQSVDEAFWNIHNFRVKRAGLPLIQSSVSIVAFESPFITVPLAEANLLFASFPGAIAFPLLTDFADQLFAYPCKDFDLLKSTVSYGLAGQNLQATGSDFALLNLSYICADTCVGPVPLGYCVAPIVGSTVLPVPVLGRPITTKLYMAFDFAKKALGIKV